MEVLPRQRDSGSPFCSMLFTELYIKLKDIVMTFVYLYDYYYCDLLHMMM
jgi:hypothetical protein